MTTQNIFDLVDTWNAGATTFTAVKMNVTDTASDAASLLMDLQVGSVSAFNVSKGGSLKLGLNASGTNVAASAVTISAPRGTGNAAGGSIIFQVAPAGSSGSAQNALATAWSISGAGNILAGTDNTYDIGASGATRPRNVYVASEAVVGDNSGNSGKLTIGIGIGRGLYFGNRGCINAVNDGVFALQNNANTDFGRLQFGGTTSSFPALKRVSANLQVIAADGTSSAGMIVGNQALATTATDGFLYVPTCVGTPTGTPTTQTGTVPIVVDTSVNKLYFYSTGAWRDAGP